MKGQAYQTARADLQHIRAATIDRLLRPVRALAKQGRRRVSVNTPLRKSIAIRTYEGLEQSAARLLRDGHGGPLRMFGGRQPRA
jgi:hypothetical protein